MGKKNSTNQALQNALSKPTNQEKLSKETRYFNGSSQEKTMKDGQFKEVKSQVSNFIEVYNDVFKVTNYGIIYILKNLVSREYHEVFNELLANNPIYITLSSENVGSKKRFLSIEDSLKVTNSKGEESVGMVATIYIDELPNLEKLSLRLATILASYYDYMTYLKGNQEKPYKAINKDSIPWKRACEMFKPFKNIAIEKHSKKGTLVSLQPNYNSQWLEKVFNAKGKLEVVRKEVENKPVVNKYKMVWKCSCKDCQELLPSLQAISEKKYQEGNFKQVTLKCMHGKEIKLVAEKIEKGQ